MAKNFNSSLTKLAEFDAMQRALFTEKAPFAVSGCTDSAAVHLGLELAEPLPEQRRVLFITYNEVRAREIWEDAQNFCEAEPLLYPARDLLFSGADVRGNLLARQRMICLKSLLEEKGGPVVTTSDALLCRLMSPLQLMERVIRVKTGDICEPAALIKKLAAAGYERESITRLPGEFSLRGGILDVFPVTEENPVRIEFFDDEVDSVRSFDSETQRSLENIGEIHIYPVDELGGEDFLPSSEAVGSGTPSPAACLLDYLSASDVVILEEPERMAEKADAVEKEYQESAVRRAEAGEAGQLLSLFAPDELWERLSRPRCLILTALPYRGRPVPAEKGFSVEARSIHAYSGQMELLLADLKKMQRDKYRCVLLLASRSRAERLAHQLADYELAAFFAEENGKDVQPGQILVTCGNLRKSYEFPSLRLAIFAEGDLFGKKRRRSRKSYSRGGKPLSGLSELSVGDYVIHEDHGLGIFRGVERKIVDNIGRDYLKISYRDGGNLYAPVSQMNKIEKYASRDTDSPPVLNKLGGAEWTATKTRVKKAVGQIAKDLVALYATRQRIQGFAFSPDSVWQKEFEEQFPYEETEDQAKAIEAVKTDMESHKIMDRLICGDVGFGKTEIAIRAAFKAVQDSKQVAYLVPTTVLAQQHYTTFAERMKDYPIRVGLLSRFRTPAEQKKTVADLKRGACDIVVGTHRLLSNDVAFKDLGLLIVDEEQRFGVSDKEKLKKLRESVDVISMTATPIPRTLHMSLIGIRDMSTLKDPPIDRLPIQTYISEYNEEIVREAIARELARGGQVYYICNKIRNIESVTARIQDLVPDAVVTFAHGQMPERELERIMFDFVNGEIDVLVSTTIVETGLDIPNVNTIIIQDSDRFGLAQLYQLRGRVGRSNRTAYAFLLYRGGRLLKEVAEKRLSAIRDFTELGSGVKISMRDLELRGAGNLLGAEQHGHMEAVGYELYAKLLGEAVSIERGDSEQFRFDTSVDFSMDANIPAAYIPNESQKLEIYRRIAEISCQADYDDVLDELIDRFGDLPRPVDYLLKIALLKARAHKVYVTELAASPSQIRLTFLPQAPLEPELFIKMLRESRGALRFKAAGDPTLTLSLKEGEAVSAAALLMKVDGLLTHLEQSLLKQKVL